VAVNVRFPAVLSESVQLPAATEPLQLSTPSLTVTEPVGVPPLDVTEKLTVTACPTDEGSGTSEVMTVVVLARLTEWGSVSALDVKFASPL
jgi:hypothetical protein